MIETLQHDHEIHNDNFNETYRLMQLGFKEALTNGPIFRTNATDLFDLYLNSLPISTPEERQYFTCSECRAFFKKYGNLVTVNDDGTLLPIAWNMHDVGFYQPAIDALKDYVSKAKIISVFFTKNQVWGIPENNGWTHFALTPPASVLSDRVDKTPGQLMAHSVHKRKNVVASFKDFGPKLLDQALRILKADSVHRSEKFVGPVQWLRDIHNRPAGRSGENLLWKAVALAPEGFCFPRSGVIATLLEDLEKGLPIEAIQRRFNKKVGGTVYQRPQTPPSAGTILQAEKLVETLGITRSLERRFARLDEVTKIWEAKADEKPVQAGGIFGHLKTKDKPVADTPIELPSKTMTWEKFVEKVLPTAKKINILIPYHGNFAAIVTATHSDAPPILKWDTPENRCPISTYVYNNGSYANRWGLVGSTWGIVDAIVDLPGVIDDEPTSKVIVINGAKDTGTDQGIALFPETLKNELHGVRSVVEAYSRQAVLGGAEEASANGLGLMKTGMNYQLKVLDESGWANYLIDRME